MELFQDIQPLTILLVLAGLVVGWILLRVFLKFTVRIFACGCLVLLLLGGGAYLLTTLLG
jgi:hypothetical protein